MSRRSGTLGAVTAAAGGGGGVRSMSALMMPSSEFLDSNYVVFWSYGSTRVDSRLRSGYNFGVGCTFLLPSDLTSLDSVKIMIGTSSATEATLKFTIRALGDDEIRATGGSVSTSSISDWAGSVAAYDYALVDISSLIPTVVADDLLVITIELVSGVTAEAAGCRIEFT